MQGTDKLNTITNIVFVLTDVLETNLLDDDNLAYKMYEYIKSFPSKLNLDLDLDNAFSHLFRKS